VKIDPLTAHDSYNARGGQHDELMLACAIAVWYGERWRPAEPPQTVSSRQFR